MEQSEEKKVETNLEEKEKKEEGEEKEEVEMRQSTYNVKAIARTCALSPLYSFRSTHFSFYKNIVYKNLEPQIWDIVHHFKNIYIYVFIF